MKVKLLPNNSRMKRLINDFGPVWEFVRQGSMPCFNGAVGIQARFKDKISNFLPDNVEIIEGNADQ